ncbi:MAG TPA: ABC transporter ATP-binding protein [Longimicrobiales bacterium]|nr:ABC transporter ATP-binding protein [Longimicrobiales bacterium]
MILTEKLSRSYGEKKALVDLDLRVEPGEIVGFLGPNGAGKSTTVRILTGLIRPTSGRAWVAGYDVLEQPLEVKRRIGYVPETPALYDALTGDEFLELVACLHHVDPANSFFRRVELLERLGLGEARDKRMAEYSKGMRQKVVIAAALLHRPEVLILDEPFDGLDANSAAVVKELIKRLAEQGCAILFCSHILEVVERVCSRIVVIDRGHKVAEGTAEEIRLSIGAATLEEAFGRLTGAEDVGVAAADLLAALDEV